MAGAVQTIIATAPAGGQAGGVSERGAEQHLFCFHRPIPRRRGHLITGNTVPIEREKLGVSGGLLPSVGLHPTES
jgi:hypothetical protein